MTGVTEWVLVPRWKMERAARVIEHDGDEHGIGLDLRDMLESASTPTPTPPAEAQVAGGVDGDLSKRLGFAFVRALQEDYGPIIELARSVRITWPDGEPCVAALSAQPRPEPDSLPRYRIKGALGATYLAADPEGDLCKYADVHRSAFFAALVAEKSAQPASAPVGVDEGSLAERIEHYAGLTKAFLRKMQAVGPITPPEEVALSGLIAAARDALAQQPAACGTCGGRGWIDDGREQDDGRMVAAPEDCPECAQRPAAVDEAIRSLPALWRQREPDNGEGYTDYDRGYDQASDECADALEAALAQPQGEKQGDQS